MPKEAAWPLHRPGSQLGRHPSAALLGPSAPAPPLNTASILPIRLGQLFDEALASGAVLFFDEADALFGKRSEVKDAHDRYANVEIGYLLQRMEAHEGVTVLATNRRKDLDEAFQRRFHISVEFPMPGEPERLRIWQSLLPDTLERAGDVDLARLARHAEVSGGEIKNAVLAAAYLAAAEGSPLAHRHLVHALRRELLKNGRLMGAQELAALGER